MNIMHPVSQKKSANYAFNILNRSKGILQNPLFILFYSSIIFLLSITTSFGQTYTDYKILRKLPIKSAGGWDYIAVDEEHQKIYASHGNQVNILDALTGDSVGVIPNTNGVHGIAFVYEKNEGYISAGKLNQVITFNLKTYEFIDSIKVGQNPDAIFYDEIQKQIVTCNGKSHDASFIDVGTDRLIATLPLGGKPETAVVGGNGEIFINIEDKNEVVKVDGVHFKILERFKLDGGEEPSGLSIDRVTNRLMVSCGNKLMLILNANTGKKVAQIPTGDGTDGNAFDPNTRLIYSSNGEGTLTIIKEESADEYTVVQNLKTEKGARTMYLNLKNHHAYLPTADFLPLAKGDRWPKMIPGTFRILEIGE